LTSRTQAAAQAAEVNQKKADAVAYSAQNESPFRSFIAPDAYGAFVINFPKDWSSSVDEEQNATQVSLILNPNFIQSTNQVVANVAARVMLIDTPSTQYLSGFNGQIQEGMINQSNITVSGQPGFNLSGTFNDNKTIREIVIPVRDKVLVFTTENKQYSNEFDEILAQCKINP
jgi:NADPH:quinone reductase-like Zn-dependent oxidoreductase